MGAIMETDENAVKVITLLQQELRTLLKMRFGEVRTVRTVQSRDFEIDCDSGVILCDYYVIFLFYQFIWCHK